MTYFGPDLSEHDGLVNFEQLHKHSDFVLLCCGYGQNYESQDDKLFSLNLVQCHYFKIPFGIYLYSYAQNTAGAEQEAEHVLRLTGDSRPQLGLWYAVEDNTLTAEPGQLVDHCCAFLNKVEQQGHYAGIRSGCDRLLGELDSDRLSRYDKWVVQHNSICEYSGPHGLWQYSSEGKIPGCHGWFNMNRGYFNYPAMAGKG